MVNECDVIEGQTIFYGTIMTKSENCDGKLRKNSFNFYAFGIGGKVLSNTKLDFEIAWVDKMTNFV